MNNLDTIDRSILRLLQENSRLRLEVLAAEIGSSVATVQRRIKAMKDSGVILKEMLVVAPDEVDFAMSFIILVELERERLDQLDAFRRKARSEAQVQQCYYITGEADFALVAIAKDMHDYQLLTQRLFFEDTNIKRFRTSVVLDRTKVGMTVPL